PPSQGRPGRAADNCPARCPPVTGARVGVLEGGCDRHPLRRTRGQLSVFACRWQRLTTAGQGPPTTDTTACFTSLTTLASECNPSGARPPPPRRFLLRHFRAAP